MAVAPQNEQVQRQLVGGEQADPKPPNPHFWLMYLYCFLVFMEWSIVVPSIVDYLRSLGNTDAEAVTNFALAQTLFAVAQCSVGLLAGWLIMKLKNFKGFFIISSVFIAVGNILYAMADSTACGSVPLLLVGRVIAGIGAGGNSVGMTYMATQCTDRKQIVAAVGRYRTSGVVATVLGGAIAGLLSIVDFNIGSYRVYQGTLPGLFTALCFVVWGIACAFLIHGKPKVVANVASAYRADLQILFLFTIVGLGSCIGSTMIYIMPTIMTGPGYGWSAGTVSIFFTVASVGALVGSLIGQEKAVIKFKPETRSFNGFLPVTISIIGMILGLGFMWMGVGLDSDAAKHVLLIIGCVVLMTAYSLVNNVGSTMLILTFTEAEKIAMTPFTTSVVALGKIVSPEIADGLFKAAHDDWIVLFLFWVAVAIGILSWCFAQRKLLTSGSPTAKTLA